MKKKLLQINSVVNWGSTGRIAEEIGYKAIEKGWESYIGYGRNDGSSKSNKIKIGTNWDVQLHGIQTRLFDNHGFGSRKATETFIREIDKINPDIIHLHNIHGYYVNIEVLFNYLSKLNTPIVWTFHDCWSITGHCTHFSYINCEKWKNHCEKCPQTKEYPTSLLIDNSYDNFEKKKNLFTSVKNMTIVCVSNWLADIVKKSYFTCPIKVIYNGVDTEVFIPKIRRDIAKIYNVENKFIILGVANIWGKRKGFLDFIELSKNLSADEIIILIGLTKAQIKELPPNIIGIEKTTNINKLAELYSLADIFINPTWEDNFPTTNLEALSCGTPVITYDTGGSSEAISAETGFVIKKGNINGIRQIIDNLSSM